MISAARGADGRDGDAQQHLSEESAHHQALGHFLWDAAGQQVEQLLVVETSGGAGVAGADDLTGLDLQVGHRVGARSLGEQQVPVHLVGVCALSGLADQHVADPHRVRLLPLQRALVERARLAVRHSVIDEQPVLEMLAGIGEVQPGQLGVAAGTVVDHGADHADQITAEGQRGVLERRVPAHPDVVVGQVNGVTGPLLHRGEIEPGAVADDDLDVVGQRRTALVHHRHLGAGLRADPDHHVAGGGVRC